MLDRLAQIILRRPRTVLMIAGLVVLIAGPAAAGLGDRLSVGGWGVPDSDSARAATALERHFPTAEPNLVVLVTDERGADDPAVAAAGARVTQRLAQEPGVSGVVSYWSTNDPGLRGESGDHALIVGHIDGDFDTALERVQQLAPIYSGNVDGLALTVGGSQQMWNENLTQAAQDATLADALVFPLVLIILIVIFGSLLAALLPLSVAMISMVASMGVFWLLTFGFDLSNFVLQTATFTGLGLAIDYSLLLVTRYREALKRGLPGPEAVREAVRTAGRTVVFSGICVAVVLSALFTVPFPFFASLAVGGVAATLFAVTASITLIPALIAVLGPRLERSRIRGWMARRELSADSDFWRRMATRVMHRPVAVSLVVLIALVLLGLPALGMRLRLHDEQVLPPSAGSARVVETLDKDFAMMAAEVSAIKVVAPEVAGPGARTVEIGQYAQRLSELPHVTRVDGLAGSYARGSLVAPVTPGSQRFATGDATYLTVIPNTDVYSDAGAQLVRDVRALPAPFPVYVGGTAATAVDTFDLLTDALSVAVVVLAISMFVLLFLLTGSLLLPLKAIVLTVLSLTATFGVLVYVFQDGHLQWLVGDFIATGALIWTIPILLFAIAFGLSMDYQVFIISRIKEERDQGKDNTTAVIEGVARTGRVVTAAAVLISMVCVVWVTSSISYMKAFGVGIPLAILMDALVVRATLLPALMKLLGNANWWAPRPLRWVYARFGLHERETLPVPVPARPLEDPVRS